MKRSLQDIISHFTDKKVLVIGEAMLDVYLTGAAHRVCREAPVPIVDIDQMQFVPGGAANTAVNLANLGAKVSYLTVIGNDHEGELVRDSLIKHGIDTSLVLGDSGRRTITKQRVMAGDHMLVRFDFGTTTDISPKSEQEFIRELTKQYHEVDAVIISDYGYGILTDRIIRRIKTLQAADENILVVDAKSLDKYRTVGATAAKPNYQELTTLLSITDPAPHGRRAAQLEEYRHAILNTVGARYVAATLDKEGALLFRRGRKPYRTYSKPVENNKAAGAGDTYVSALTLALAAKANIEQASDLAQAAAMVILGKSGTATCGQDELVSAMTHDNKYLPEWTELKRKVQRLKAEGRKIVFTNGCFDILHGGHVQYLQQAKARGDILVVALNSDESVARLKGPQRPVNTLVERARVMAGLGAVDIVTAFTQDTPVDLLEVVRPDIYVKGGDYKREDLVEVPVVERHGGTVEILNFLDGRSTSNVIAKIRQHS
ncbi:D-glycero-beta-D-manno-heptose 1-phosphate adenylyltransferase [Candidatus Saccharibacteria bacterium]|nr:D-glycero-beta-D-manno-heptose 1-phosphate adenylyltransferase [Candidatus Saccharibacteria bacterium]